MNSDIDFVIIWVDGNDPAWQAEKRNYTQEYKERTNDPIFEKWCDNPMRYRDWDNLQYWFRGVEKFAPWVHHIYFVTWGHLPPWLNTDHPKLTVIKHEDFIPKQYLPTFQANPIEDNLHRIPGLSEQFVYFNDDTFIVKEMKPIDFFYQGLPCDCAILNAERSDRYGIPYANITAEIINDHFDKRTCMRKNWSKWINLKYSKELVRTLLLLPWKHFSCLYQHHLPSSMLKATYEKLWAEEYDALDKTCREKFRGKGQVNQYLFLDWQRVTGTFHPRSTNIGKSFILGDIGTEKSQFQEAVAYITGQRGKLLCLNDGEMGETEFAEKKITLKKAFQTILPDKSAYEK